MACNFSEPFNIDKPQDILQASSKVLFQLFMLFVFRVNKNPTGQHYKKSKSILTNFEDSAHLW